MKIIFLDIDGVLNTTVMDEDDKVGNGGFKMSWKLISMLNEFTDQTDTKLVISSTWRSNTVEETIDDLRPYGITGEIVGVTPSLPSLRGNEILDWIQKNIDLIECEYHKYEDYVILDDDSDMLYWQKDNFILIDRWVGITPSVIFRMSKILKTDIDHDKFYDIWLGRT